MGGRGYVRIRRAQFITIKYLFVCLVFGLTRIFSAAGGAAVNCYIRLWLCNKALAPNCSRRAGRHLAGRGAGALREFPGRAQGCYLFDSYKCSKYLHIRRFCPVIAAARRHRSSGCTGRAKARAAPAHPAPVTGRLAGQAAQTQVNS